MKDDILAALGAVLDDDHAHAVLDHRRTKKCALTVFAAKLLAKQFALCADPNGAAEEMILRGWTGFKAEWINQRARGSIMGAGQRLLEELNGQESRGMDHNLIEPVHYPSRH